MATVSDATDRLGLAPDVADALETDAGGAVRVLDGAGGRTVRRAEPDDALDTGTVRLGAGTGDRLDVESSDVVLLEPA
ncbi:hypothetical protein BRC63_06425, partial [Halobacteriales archaeon QH_10_70_21]